MIPISKKIFKICDQLTDEIEDLYREFVTEKVRIADMEERVYNAYYELKWLCDKVAELEERVKGEE